MSFPLEPPIRPMLGKLARRFPTTDGLRFEPKWDGFRTLVFRDGDELYLQSRDGKPLARYFPELLDPLRAALPDRCVVDGEIVVARPHGLDFADLQLRLHPAASRVRTLSGELPASVVLFDLLADDINRCSERFADRRALLETAVRPNRTVRLTPSTPDPVLAHEWFERFEGAGLDGVMAKDPESPYEPGKRTMLKVKHERTADVVVAGFRWHKSGPVVGSLLLGLWGTDGRLQHVGVAASFTVKRRKELVYELAPLREGALDGHPWADWASRDVAHWRQPGMQSRWSAGKSLQWEAIRAERVAEVRYGHLQGTRFRHTAHFLRWRPDRDPASCTYGQLDVVAPAVLEQVFGT
ncbi:MAG: ATP-dependent DNA ligase [Myxococcota bacterium]|jgi:ATP-dependent DNA ligase